MIDELIFLSTLPARGATADVMFSLGVFFLISIHAPREGSDRFFQYCPHCGANFYPRSPRGERPFGGK